MAERFRQVHPDEILTLRDGRELAVVSEEHFVNEVAKIASFIAFAGGTMSAVVYRQPTDLKGEMATVGAVLSWADRTDARPQPEPASAPPQMVGVGEVGEMEAPQREWNAKMEAEVARRDGGNGAGALPFQLSETREHPEARLTPYEPPQPTPVEEAIPEYEALRARLGRAGVQQDNARLLKGLEAAVLRTSRGPRPR
jgi:hypothetical protein